MNFVVFNADGNPVRAGVCPEAMVERQAREGETAIEWDRENGSPSAYRLIDGELVEI